MHMISKFTAIKLGIVASALVLGSCGGSASNSEATTAEQSTLTEQSNDFISIFNGQNLDGWDGDPEYWRVEGGTIVGEVTPEKPLKNNTFLIWQGGELGDFELKGEFKITEAGNSGINYRSDLFTEVPYALRGYQADIDGRNSYTGQNYEERKRTTLAYRGQSTTIQPREGELRENVERNAWKGLEVTKSLGDIDSLKTLIKAEDWNSFHLVIKGNKLQHYINGVLMSEVVDEDTINRKMEGLLGIQVHVGPPMKVQYRDLQLKKL
ncbi:MAG TPA: DUF1080 domain-containing protein [Cyclobacteriaceae bacterium]|nr:DUF1080 domain-containing protein [Cyclobacteriaceae bacterium]